MHRQVFAFGKEESLGDYPDGDSVQETATLGHWQMENRELLGDYGKDLIPKVHPAMVPIL